MSISRPANGNTTHELAHAAALQTVTNLAVLKNVPLNPEKRAEIAQGALEWLTAGELAELIALRRDGTAALTRTVDNILDRVMIARILGHAAAIEGKEDFNDPAVSIVAEDIARLVQAEATDKTCLRWPPIEELIERHFTTHPRAPIVTASSDDTGSV
jgi:hypothetical protein